MHYVAASKPDPSLPLVREAFSRTVRLVASARLRQAVLSPLADNVAELDLLAELEAATSGRMIAEARGAGALTPKYFVHGVPHAQFINASFAYAKPREPMRFNPANRGAWYAAFATETCIAEVGHHLTSALIDAGDLNAVVEYSELLASMSGVFVDLRRLSEHTFHDSLHADPAIGYVAGNILAARVLAEGHNGIIYPSVRHPSGICVVALWPNVVQSVAQGAMVRLTWTGSPHFSVDRL